MKGSATLALLVITGGALLLSAARGLPPGDLAGTVSVGARPEANAVVWLETTAPRPQPAAHATVLEQRNLTFSPRVLAVRAGTTVEFPNRDRVFHNVFSFHDGKRFDLGMYPVGTVKTVTFGQPGLSRIYCNIHPNMAAYVLAVDSGYFAVSDAAGRFVIPAVPEGAAIYHAWRAGGATLTGSVAARQAMLEVRWP